MNRPLVSLLLLPAIGILLVLSGCDSSNSTVESQLIYGVSWLPDESGLLAFIEQTTVSSIDGSTTYGANLYHVGTDGTIGNAINGSSIGIQINYLPASPQVFVSSDGQTAITQFGNDIFSVGVQSGNVNDIIQGTGLLGVSNDFKYIATTNSPANLAAIILANYNNSSGTPVQILPQQTVPRVASNRALWISNDRYALTINDSVAPDGIVRQHIEIYDINGNPLMAIPDGDVSISAAAFSSGSNDLFFRTHTYAIDRINLTTLKRDTIISNDTVSSFDASIDGTYLAYVSDDTLTRGNLYAVNVTSGNKMLEATGAVEPFISPKEDKVAFTTANGTLQVPSFTKPQ